MNEVMQRFTDNSQSAVRKIRILVFEFWNWMVDDSFLTVVMVPVGIFIIGLILFALFNPGSIVTATVNAQ